MNNKLQEYFTNDITFKLNSQFAEMKGHNVLKFIDIWDKLIFEQHNSRTVCISCDWCPPSIVGTNASISGNP